MLRYVIKRVLLVIPTLLGAAALVFVLMRLIPGDVCVMRLGSSGGTFDPKAIALCHAELGMERPLLIQFIDFVWGCMRLDFGTSMWSGQPVTTEIMARLPISVEIAILATVVAIAIAIPLGTISAVKQNTWIDYAVRVFAIENRYPEVANRLCCCKTHSGGECCTRVATCGGELIGCFCAFPSVPGARQFSSRPIPLSRAKRTTFVSP